MTKGEVMKRILAVGMLCYFSLIASSAQAENFYLKGNLGYNTISDSEITISDTASGVGMEAEQEYDSDIFYSGAVGYDFGAFRVDGEVEYSSNDIDKITINAMGFLVPVQIVDSKVNNLSIMVNGYYDFENSSIATPYVGLGLGSATIEIEDPTGSWDDTIFAYQASLGVAMNIHPMVDIDFAYRYFATAEPSFVIDEVTVDAEYQAHIVMAGVKINL